MEHKDRTYNHFWFVWIVLTFLYITLFLAGTLPYIPLTAFIGLFVPFGFWNVALAFSSLKVFIVIPLLGLSLYYSDFFAFKFGITSSFKRLVFNLIWLFFLTLVVDLVLSGKWMSLHLLIGNTNLFVE